MYAGVSFIKMDVIARELNDLGLFAYNSGDLYCFTGNNFVKTDYVLKTHANRLYPTVSSEDILDMHYMLYSGIDTEFDTDRSLIAFTNCVYSRETNTFRPGLPSDLITRTTGYHYTEPNDPGEAESVRDYILSILPAASIREITHRDTPVMFFTGTGGNGKTSLLTCIKRAFGEYAEYIPSERLTEKKRKVLPQDRQFLIVNESSRDDTVRYENVVRVTLATERLILVGNTPWKYYYNPPPGVMRVINFTGTPQSQKDPMDFDRSAIFKFFIEC